LIYVTEVTPYLSRVEKQTVKNQIFIKGEINRDVCEEQGKTGSGQQETQD